jgi:hypothetical protein
LAWNFAIKKQFLISSQVILSFLEQAECYLLWKEIKLLGLHIKDYWETLKFLSSMDNIKKIHFLYFIKNNNFWWKKKINNSIRNILRFIKIIIYQPSQGMLQMFLIFNSMNSEKFKILYKKICFVNFIKIYSSDKVPKSKVWLHLITYLMMELV